MNPICLLSLYKPLIMPCSQFFSSLSSKERYFIDFVSQVQNMCLSETFPFLCFLLEIIALQHFRVISFLSLSSLNVCLNKRKELVETAIYWTKNLYCIIFQSSVLNGGKSHLVSLHSSFLGSIKETTEVKNCLLSYVYSFKLWFMQPSRKKIKTKKKLVFNDFFLRPVGDKNLISLKSHQTGLYFKGRIGSVSLKKLCLDNNRCDNPFVICLFDRATRG